MMAKAKEDRPASAMEAVGHLEADFGEVPRHEAGKSRLSLSAPVSQSAETITFETNSAAATTDTTTVGLPTLAPDDGTSAFACGVGARNHARRRGSSDCCVLLAVGGVLVFGKHGENPALSEGTPTPEEPVVVGVLHSQSGTMAVSENPVVDSTLMAIEEVRMHKAV